ncbi:hypothetical protein V6N11_024840 [Hibiscus sabdariffa]|uniref:S-protein homolog n=1 Tax=Hibiscus sabdariffa TaxID=183260 RepID=A0ABR2QNP8_9ROSI
MHLFLLVLTTLMAANPSTSTSSAPAPAPAPTKDKPNSLFSTWHVHVVNGLSNNKILLVHCKSKDDDLGERHLTVGSETQWHFRLAAFGSTLFFCFMASESDHVHVRLDVFWEDKVLFRYCNWQSCIWTARDDGIYLKNIPDNHDVFMHGWEMGSMLLANSTSV